MALTTPSKVALTTAEIYMREAGQLAYDNDTADVAEIITALNAIITDMGEGNLRPT